MLAIEQCSVADRADTNTAALVGDLVAERRAFVAVRAEETKFHQLVRAQQSLQLGEECRSEAAFAELERRGKRLAESAEVRSLRAGEREIVHGPLMTRNRANEKGFSRLSA